MWRPERRSWRARPIWRGRWPARWQPLAWRLGHLRRRGREAAARALLHLAIRVPRLRRLPRRLVAAVERVLFAAADDSLFDRALYLERNPDVRAAGGDPMAHYLRHGWAEGRSPNGWLDETRYRRQAGLTRRDTVSALAHYLALGRARGPGPKRASREVPYAARPAPADPAPGLGDQAQGGAAAAAAPARPRPVAPPVVRAGTATAGSADTWIPGTKALAQSMTVPAWAQ